MRKFLLNRFTLIIFLLLLFIFVSSLSYATNVSAHLQDSVFRLHVIANSDESFDQELKYIVRDKIIEYMEVLCKSANSKEDYISIANENLDKIKEIAKNTITENGYNYDVNVSIGNFSFPTKTYGDVSFPAGFYDALRIEIGSASGQNWWCVMFPPLCFIDVTTGIVPDESKETLKQDISNEEYSLITGKSPDVKFKFKLIEMFESWGLVGKK